MVVAAQCLVPGLATRCLVPNIMTCRMPLHTRAWTTSALSVSFGIPLPHQVLYCGVACQGRHWHSGHREECSLLRQGRA